MKARGVLNVSTPLLLTRPVFNAITQRQLLISLINHCVIQFFIALCHFFFFFLNHGNNSSGYTRCIEHCLRPCEIHTLKSLFLLFSPLSEHQRLHQYTSCSCFPSSCILSEPPVFIKEPDKHITAEMEKVVDIPCQARGEHWFKSKICDTTAARI